MQRHKISTNLRIVNSNEFSLKLGVGRQVFFSSKNDGSVEKPNFIDDKPTQNYASEMSASYSSLPNEIILHMCIAMDPGAHAEALRRNIMKVDVVSYDEAEMTLNDIKKEIERSTAIHEIPYKVGLGSSLVAGFVSIPLVFHHGSALWCHDLFITAEIPDAVDRETFLEIGSWSWAWMEPVLGQISFLLLTLQFARSQLLNLGIRPYGGFVKRKRAQMLIKMYPQYCPSLLTYFAESHNSRENQ